MAKVAILGGANKINLLGAASHVESVYTVIIL